MPLRVRIFSGSPGHHAKSSQLHLSDVSHEEEEDVLTGLVAKGHTIAARHEYEVNGSGSGSPTRQRRGRR